MRWLSLWKIKKVLQLLIHFKKFYMSLIANKTKYGWIKGLNFDNRSMESWLQGNDTEMYSTQNEEKSVVAEKFIRTLKNKNYKYMASIWKNVHIDSLANIVNKYNNTYHSPVNMNPADVKSSTYSNFYFKFIHSLWIK